MTAHLFLEFLGLVSGRLIRGFCTSQGPHVAWPFSTTQPEKGGTKARSAQGAEAGKVYGGRRRRKERGAKGEADMSQVPPENSNNHFTQSL